MSKPDKEKPVGAPPESAPSPNDDFHKIEGPNPADDLFVGAADISMFLFGTRKKRRSVYHLAKTAKRKLPFVPYLGSQIALRKSTLSAFLWAQERQAFVDFEDFVRLGVLLQRLEDHIRTAKQEPNTPRDIQTWRLLLAETARTLSRISEAQGKGSDAA